MSAQPPDPGVYISPAQTYAEVQRLARIVDQIDGKLDRLLADNTQIRADLSDHEQRIRALELGETERQRRDDARLVALETRRWPLPTIGALAGVIGTAAGVAALFIR